MQYCASAESFGCEKLHGGGVSKERRLRKNGESYLEDEHLDKILSAYSSIDDIEGFKRTVSIEEISGNKYDLSLQKYVFINNSFTIESYDITDCFAQWLNVSNDLHNSLNRLSDLLK